MVKPGYRSKVPWMSDPLIKRARKTRNKAKDSADKSGLSAHYDLLEQAESQLNDSVSEAKIRYEQRLANKSQYNPRLFFNYVKNYTRSKSNVDCLEKDGVLYNDDAAMANILNDHFASVMTQEPDSGELPQFEPDIENPPIDNIVVLEENVRDIMRKLKPSKASGPDGIHPLVLREVLGLARPLCILYNFSLTSGTLPRDWLDANICALHKKGSKKNPNNYRPVSLTSQVVKVLERVILKYMLQYCVTNNLFSCHQHGFQSGCSCFTQLLECLNDWTEGFDTEHCGVDIIYTDFSKAFDSVPHRRLLYKLHQLGIRGQLLAWIRSFLTNRRQRTVLNGSKAAWRDVISGVPQGTILGPILFLLYVNDLPEIVTSTAKLFADDCKLYRNIFSIEDCDLLQADLDRLSEWSNKWLLFFNTSKCVVLRIRASIQYTYFLNNEPLSVVGEQKDLGVIISSDLKPSKHISYICSKANQRIGMLKRCITDRSRETIHKFYKALIRPILETCSPAWSPWLKKDKDLLCDVQERCQKLCGEPLESLESRRDRADLCEVYKILNGNYKIDKDSYFQISDNSTRGHPVKLFKPRCRTELRRNFFSHRVVDMWNSLPRHIVMAPSIEAFRERLRQYVD